MSGKSGNGIDRRAARTRTALAEALIRLAPAKGYDAISVDDLVRDAEIGRSTFYGHYAGKADFLDRSYADMMRAANARAWADGDGPLLPVRSVFAHMLSARDFVRSLAESGAYDALMARREVVLRDVVEENLRRRGVARPREASVMLAGAYNALARWWIRNGFEPAPEDMQAWFDRFAHAAIAQAQQANASA